MLRLVFLTVLALYGCAGLDRPGLESYDDIRGVIILTTDPATGIITASSERAAKVEIRVRDVGVAAMDESGLMGGGPVNSQRSMQTAFFIAERMPTGKMQVFVVWRRHFPISEYQLQEKPWTEIDSDKTGLIGVAWREVPRELVEFRNECPGSRFNCTRYATDRYHLSEATVRTLLTEGQEKIRISFNDVKGADWRLDVDELVATLDAIGFVR